MGAGSVTQSVRSMVKHSWASELRSLGLTLRDKGSE